MRLVSSNDWRPTKLLLFKFKGIESLKRKRCEIMQSILEDQRKKEILERELAVVKERLSVVCSSLDENLNKKTSIDESIEKCESAYMKVSCSLIVLKERNIEPGFSI